MKIISNHVLSKVDIIKIEESMNAKYVCDTPLPAKGGGWVNSPGALFYTEQAHPEGSNYFLFFQKPFDDQWYISDGLRCAEQPFPGLQIKEGEVMISTYRHDFFRHGNTFVDGGRDYLRSGGGGSGTPVTLQIVEDRVEIAEGV